MRENTRGVPPAPYPVCGMSCLGRMGILLSWSWLGRGWVPLSWTSLGNGGGGTPVLVLARVGERTWYQRPRVPLPKGRAWDQRPWGTPRKGPGTRDRGYPPPGKDQGPMSRGTRPVDRHTPAKTLPSPSFGCGR